MQMLVAGSKLFTADGVILSLSLLQRADTGAESFLATLVLLYLLLVFGAIFYIFLAFALMVIARKTGTQNGWLAWVPIGNLFLMCRIAGRPGWWVVLCLIPLVNLIVLIIIEQCAVALVRLMDSNFIEYELTRPWRDGGRDAWGKYRIGTSQESLKVEFALEAKCYRRNRSVGVREVSRLISP